LNGFDDGRGGDAGLVHSGGGGDYGNDLGWVAGVVWSGDLGCGGGEVEREDLVDGEVLCGEDAIEAFEREGAFAVEEVRDVRRFDSGGVFAIFKCSIYRLAGELVGRREER
jgi:hypothetical protein